MSGVTRDSPPGPAVVLANGLYRSPFAKTTHGLVRGPSRWPVAAVVDAAHAGADAGELLDGRRRGIPIVASVREALAGNGPRPGVCVVGVATAGGVLPPALRADLLAAADAGLDLVNGLHHLLADEPELAALARERGGRILDIRRPRPTSELRFWSGEVLSLRTPRIAVLGTDCALGKRTTSTLLVTACRKAGLRADMVFTGQTGWLQGWPHGFILDATPNDFVCGELERAILECARESAPDLIFLEGQSALRNPSGPCGSELIVAAGARGVILQHAPGREHFEDLDTLGCRIPPLAEEIALIRLLGAEVWALTLNQEGLTGEQAEEARRRLQAELRLPVLLPLVDDLAGLVEVIRARVAAATAA